MSPSSVRIKQPAEVRRAGLVEAALALAAVRNPASISTTDLAHAVGITQGAVPGLVMQTMVSRQTQAMVVQAPAVFTLWLRGVTNPRKALPC